MKEFHFIQTVSLQTMYSTLPFDIFIKNNHHCMRPCLVYVFFCALWPPPHFNWWPCLLSSTWFKLFHHSFVTKCHSLSYACVHTYSCLFIFMFTCIVICYQCMVYIYLCTCCHILNCNIQYKLHLLCLNNPILHYLYNCLCRLTGF